MNIIHKFIPKNPINDATLERIKERVKHAVEVFGEIYFDLKMFEKYKLDDISHYYIKYYSRQRAPRLSGDAYQQGYAKVRIDELDTRDEKLIRALTICPDRSALKDLLYPLCYIIMLLTDYIGIKDTRSGLQRIDSGIYTHLSNLPAENCRSVKM